MRTGLEVWKGGTEAGFFSSFLSCTVAVFVFYDIDNEWAEAAGRTQHSASTLIHDKEHYSEISVRFVVDP